MGRRERGMVVVAGVVAGVVAAGAVAGCAHTRERTLPPASATPYRVATETVDVAPAEWPGLYRAVLQFYRPGPGQARWLDRRLLPAGPLDAGDAELDQAAARRLIEASGVSRLCLADRVGECTAQRGGRLRISAPFAADTATARVVVRYEAVDAYVPTPSYIGTQVFLLRRDRGGWAIAARAPAAERRP